MSKRKVHLFLLVGVLGSIAVLVLVLGFAFGFIGAHLQGEKSFDFGVVPIERPHAVLEHTFLLTNKSGHTLELKSAVPSCGCTTTDWPESPVLDGGQLAVPVNLKLQRSRYRSSKVRLVFKTGEVVVLRIEGTGRFTQRLQSLPPILKLVDGGAKGTRSILSLEWYAPSRPPLPTINSPKQVTVETNSWVLGKAGDSNMLTPDIWTLQLHSFLEGELEDGSALLIQMDESKTLHIPLEQVESLGGPKSVWDHLND